MVDEPTFQLASRSQQGVATPDAADRLASHLRHLTPAVMAVLSKRAGISGRAGARARAGRKVSAISYILLCSAVGLDVVTGAPGPSIRAGSEIVWWLFGAALFLTRSRRHLDLRSAAALVGTSAATLSRAERGQPIAIESYLRVARFIGLPPASFLSFTGNTNCNTLKKNKDACACGAIGGNAAMTTEPRPSTISR